MIFVERRGRRDNNHPASNANLAGQERIRKASRRKDRNARRLLKKWDEFRNRNSRCDVQRRLLHGGGGKKGGCGVVVSIRLD